jgi:DEAD/DEAH box helicase domain-containing protein
MSLNVCEQVENILKQIEGLEVAYSTEYPPSPAKLSSWNDLGLQPELSRYLQRNFPDGLFAHQKEALRLILGNNHTIISTRTSSGKSLIYTTSVFQAFLKDKTATSLFLYPQKALANDQFTRLKEMYKFLLGREAGSTEVARYDGATASEDRPAIRGNGQFVLTNPDMLHYGLLQYHGKWDKFFRNLKHVIIDEAHSYRGIFGSNVAYILRRLRCICQHYGSTPTFISTSATIDNPAEHLEKLTGIKFKEVGQNQDGSIQGYKKIWLARSDKSHYYQLGRTLTKAMVENNFSCLTFCPGRVTAERLVSDLSDSDTANSKIAVYRAGLSSKQREEIEDGMRTGRTKGVFSTTALELGIDIGLLDVVICVGLPNTMMSLWQRAGRVGRNGKEGAIIFIAADKPLDTYFCEYPKELFSRNFEPLALTLKNRRLICNHLACAIQENGDEESLNLNILGEEIEHALELRKSGHLNDDIFYSDEPHMRTPVRTNDSSNYTLKVQDESIGEIDAWHMIREAYPKGIYLHGGVSYRVKDILRGTKEIRLSREFTRNITIPRVNTSVRTRQIRAITRYPKIQIKLAGFEVTARLVAIQEKTRAGELIHQYTGNQGLPPHRLPTEGVSIELLSDMTRLIDSKIKRGARDSVVRAIERLIRGLFPIISGPCDLMDFDTFTNSSTDTVTWYLYDQVRDGIGLTAQAYNLVPDLLSKALDQIRSCKCIEDGGCFCCIRNPEEAEDISKADCITVLESISEEFNSSVPIKEDFNIDVLQEQDSIGICPKEGCGANIRHGDKFCSNCGHPIDG